MPEPGVGEVGTGSNNPLLLEKRYIDRCDDGDLPSALASYKHQLAWPFTRSETNIYLAAGVGDPDYPSGGRVTHTGIDFQVEAGAPIECIEDGQIVYATSDERGDFGNIIIQGSNTHIVYRYCHVNLANLPWDVQKLFSVRRDNPMVKAGQVIGGVGKWFKELPPKVNIPNEVEAIYGRKYDHLHLETAYNPHPLGSIEFAEALADRSVEFNPLLVLQKPEDYFKQSAPVLSIP
jgi:hypothetical protein